MPREVEDLIRRLIHENEGLRFAILQQQIPGEPQRPNFFDVPGDRFVGDRAMDGLMDSFIVTPVPPDHEPLDDSNCWYEEKNRQPGDERCRGIRRKLAPASTSEIHDQHYCEYDEDDRV